MNGNLKHTPHQTAMLPELVCRIDPQGRFTYLHPQSAFMAANHRAGTTLLGQPGPAGIAPATERSEWSTALQAVLTHARAVQLELSCWPAKPPCQCFMLPEMNSAGEVAGIAVVALGSIGQQVVAAESDLKARRAHLSNISHELRTPLAGMLNLVELIGENPQKNCTAENIELILEAGQQLKAMIATLLGTLQNESATRIPPGESPPGENASTQSVIDDTLTRLGSLRVLVVEDNYINLLAFRQTLEQSGFRVEEAMNGEEALVCLQREPFDLVLMDVCMPVMDGLEATRRIRAMPERRLRETKVIALTGYSMADDRQRIMDAGADGMIIKPVDTRDLIRAIKALFP